MGESSKDMKWEPVRIPGMSASEVESLLMVGEVRRLNDKVWSLLQRAVEHRYWFLHVMGRRDVGIKGYIYETAADLFDDIQRWEDEWEVGNVEVTDHMVDLAFEGVRLLEESAAVFRIELDSDS